MSAFAGVCNVCHRWFVKMERTVAQWCRHGLHLPTGLLRTSIEWLVGAISNVHIDGDLRDIVHRVGCSLTSIRSVQNGSVKVSGGCILLGIPSWN